MIRIQLVVGNWKMHRTPLESADYLGDLLPRLAGPASLCDIAIAPPFTSLAAAAGILGREGPVALAAQDAHWEEEGPFTGEVSARSLAEAGCRYVIVGHSERREHSGDTDRRVNRKARAVLFWKMIPIVCVGEKADARAAGRHFEVVDSQMKLALADLRPDPDREIVVAYEPVWAIGTGRTATAAQASEMHGRIRAELKLAFGADRAGRTRILYGGSVTPANASGLLGAPDVDGALVGGASLDAESFGRICEAAAGREKGS